MTFVRITFATTLSAVGTLVINNPVSDATVSGLLILTILMYFVKRGRSERERL